jgi:DNA-directed RNA polymerase III subunit RPC7
LQPKVNEIPKFSGRPFSTFAILRYSSKNLFSADKELFPKELWPALEGEAGKEVRKHLVRANEKKAAMMAGMKDKKPNDKHARVLEKLFSVPADEDAEEADEEQEQDAGMQNHIPLADQLLIV